MIILKEPLVSICCLAFNHESYIRDCVEGFLMQKTDFPFEVLIHDDASTDNTATIIREYELKYPDIIKPIYQSENQYSKGVRATLVYQFPRAKGKYIAMCEGDDYWTDPYKLQKQVEAMEANKEINICSHISILFDDELKKNIGLIGNNGKGKRIIPVEEVILNFGSVCPLQSILMKNTKIDKFKEMASNSYGGHGLIQVFWAHPSGVLYLPEIMSVYRTNSIGSITKNILINKSYYLSVIKKQNTNLLELDKYYGYVYSTVIKKKIKQNHHKIVGSRLVHIKDKIKLIKENSQDFSIPIVIILLGRSFMAKIKHYIINAKKIKSLRISK